ncbi:gastrin-releasing peptide receptor-like [Amphiura filiformis]|uniref:gastrin-releasing peptide receptor-like n=1 Tax=Amphiura filiformis TaxID=82378 RepID=UPI003B2131DB
MADASQLAAIMMTTLAPNQDGIEMDGNVTDECDVQNPEHLWSPILLGIFSLIGIVGNLGLLIVILINPQLRTSPNAMVLNLTIGDLLFLLMSAPFHIEHEIHPCWQYRQLGCKLISAGQVVGMCVCILSLTAVSGERYMAITRKIRIGKGKAFCQTLVAMIAIWSISIIFATPVFFLADMFPGVPICLALPHFEPSAKWYVCILCLFMYVIPLIFITVCYLLMARALFRSTRTFKGEKQPGERQFVMRRRLAVIILVMSVFFACFWLPYHVYQIWFELSFDYEMIQTIPSWTSNAIHFNRQFHFFMAFANSCLNPWIVFFMSSKHRKGITECCCPGKKAIREPTSAMTTATSKVRNSNWNDSSHAQYTEMSAM